jgi:hypothetical protein
MKAGNVITLKSLIVQLLVLCFIVGAKEWSFIVNNLSSVIYSKLTKTVATRRQYVSILRNVQKFI